MAMTVSFVPLTWATLPHANRSVLCNYLTGGRVFRLNSHTGFFQARRFSQIRMGSPGYKGSESSANKGLEERAQESRTGGGSGIRAWFHRLLESRRNAAAALSVYGLAAVISYGLFDLFTYGISSVLALRAYVIAGKTVTVKALPQSLFHGEEISQRTSWYQSDTLPKEKYHKSLMILTDSRITCFVLLVFMIRFRNAQILAITWGINNFSRPFRVAGALALAPFVDRRVVKPASHAFNRWRNRRNA